MLGVDLNELSAIKTSARRVLKEVFPADNDIPHN